MNSALRYPLALLCLGCFATPAFATVGLNASTKRPLPPQFYGANGQDRGGTDWNPYQYPLNQMNYSLLRIPGGTTANYWDWDWQPPGGGSAVGDFLNAPDPTNNLNACVDVGYWDGHTGPSAHPASDSELVTELHNTAATPLLVLNLLTDPDPMNVGTQRDSHGYNSFNPSGTPKGPGPDWNYQMLWLTDMAQKMGPSLGAIQYVELGNEYYLAAKPGYSLVYPDGSNNSAGAAYAAIANTWVANLRAMQPDGSGARLKIDVVGNHISDPTHSSRGSNWLPSMFTKLTDADAVTLHLYPDANLPGQGATAKAVISGGGVGSLTLTAGGSGYGATATHVSFVGGGGSGASATANIVSGAVQSFSNLHPGSGYTSAPQVQIWTGLDTTANIQSMLAAPYNLWAEIQANDIPVIDSASNLIPQGLPIWVTEYNLNDNGNAVYGTWAHALYLAEMSLLFLSPNSAGNFAASQVQMALHHCALGNAFFGDLETSGAGFATSIPGAPPTPPGTDPNYYPTLGAGLATTGPNSPPSTTVSSQTAGAIVMAEIQAAAAAQSEAEEISFPNAAIITANNNEGSSPTTQYSSLYGWCFYCSTGSPTGGQSILLNLDNVQHSVNVGVVFSGTTATYDQISCANPATPITDGIATTGVTALLNQTLTATGAANLVLPPYSITRIANPGFIIEITQGLQNGPQGAQVPYSVNVQAVGGWTGTVNLTASVANSTGWPVTLNPTSLANPPAQASPVVQPAPASLQSWANSTLTIGVGAHAALGNTHSITVTGAGGSLTNTAPSRITVTTP